MLEYSWSAFGYTVLYYTVLCRCQTTPSPIVVPPSENWDGIDGPWSSFTFRIGTPSQTVRLLVSTASQETWAVLPEACTYSDFNSCTYNRGEVFQPNASSSWSQKGYYELYVERNLDYTGNGLFGNDTLGIGFPGNGPALNNQIIGGYIAHDFYIGMFGANPKPTNFTSVEDPQTSFLTSLHDENLIPSVSFGYTAGAPYRLKKVLGSLTLGGYDASRFTPNFFSFTFAPDNSRDIVVGIQLITTDSSRSTASLLPSGVLAYIDSTVSHIWLPEEACKAFESVFGLVHDNATDLYLVNNTLHDSLLQLNPNITFTLGNSVTGGETIEIKLPYASFDLEAQPPLVENATRYFPLRKAENDTQFTLGRTFLQEAYLIIDWQRSNFSVSQCRFDADMSQDIIAIPTLARAEGHNSTGGNSTTIVTSGSLSSATIAGIIAGSVVTLIILVLSLAIFILRGKKRHINDVVEATKHGHGNKPELETSVLGRDRLTTYSVESERTNSVSASWVDEKTRVSELPSPQEEHPIFKIPARSPLRGRRTISELPGDHPKVSEMSLNPRQADLPHMSSTSASARSSEYWEHFSPIPDSGSATLIVSPLTPRSHDPSWIHRDVNVVSPDSPTVDSISATLAAFQWSSSCENIPKPPGREPVARI